MNQRSLHLFFDQIRKKRELYLRLHFRFGMLFSEVWSLDGLRHLIAASAESENQKPSTFLASRIVAVKPATGSLRSCEERSENGYAES